MGDRSVSDGGIVERFRRARRDPALAVLEGFHAIKHAARFGAEFVTVARRDTEALASMTRALAPDVAPVLADAEVVPEAVFAQLAPRPHPTGVVAIARRPSIGGSGASALESLLADARPALVVVLEDPRRPENLGAVVRAAAAAGAAGVVALGGADPWHPAALRGGAGLQFALTVVRAGSLEELLGSRPLVALDPSGQMLTPAALPARALLAFGSERRGLSEALLARADRRLAIPMRQGVSSLNLATAVAVALYAWRWGVGPQA